jgi:hypothetical protein
MVALVGVRIPVVGVGSGSAAKPYKHEPAARWNLVRIDEALDGRFPISVEVRGLNGDGEVGPIGRHAWL